MKRFHAAAEKDYNITKKMSGEKKIAYYTRCAQKVANSCGYKLIWHRKTGYGKLVKKNN